MTAPTALLPPTSGFAYSDINGLKRIGDDAEGLRAAAAQFESLFVGMVLKSMRDANKVLAESNPLSSPELTMHQEMLDQQWAIHIAENGGLGLAPIIEAQLRGERRAQPEEGPARALDGRPGLRQSLASGDVPRRAPQVGLALQEGGSKQPDFTSREAFVGELLPTIEDAVGDSGLDPLHVLAQSALETGWGRHVIHGADGRSSNNLFGIKAGPEWSGERVAVQTLEVVDGHPRVETAEFRSYPDRAAAVRDYVDFLQGQGRYRQVLDARDDHGFASAIQRSGYATDPAYGHKILSVLASLPGLTDG